MAEHAKNPPGPRGEIPAPTLLLVDDEQEVRDSIGEVLRAYGYEVLLASTGEEAVSLIREHGARIGLLLTDIRMPGMSGHELAEWARTVVPDLKVILMSGSDPDTDHPGMQFIRKPATPGELHQQIRQALAD